MATKEVKTPDVQIELTLERDTKGTFVFKSPDKSDVISSLYIRKEGFPKGAPKKIRVTVDSLD